jgi:hypothetical protein
MLMLSALKDGNLNYSGSSLWRFASPLFRRVMTMTHKKNAQTPQAMEEEVLC